MTYQSRRQKVPETAPELLARLFPPLGRYWPNLSTVSAKQAAFLLLDDLEAFYGGAVGGGKSDALLAAALQYVDVPGYAALILRRTFRQLDQPDAIMARSKEWLMPHRANGVRWGDDAKRWTFPSGATVTFGYLDHANDVYNYQGAAYHFVGWDELTEFDETLYTYLFSRTRRRKDLQELGVPIRHRSASNPGNIGHVWVKRRFIDPQTRDKNAVFIPAKVRDNPGLDADEYVKALAHLPEGLQRQYVDGDWDIVLGAAFAVTDDHLVDGFELADSISRYEALDYGFNGAPWGLWATDYEGNIVAVDMGYWRDSLPSEITPEIIENRKHGWGLRNVCYADPSLWHRTGGKDRWGQPAMLVDEFSDNGVRLTQANNDPRAGMARLRELLKPDAGRLFPSWHPRAGQSGSPRLFLDRVKCKDLVDELQAAPLKPADQRDGGEIVDPKWESAHGHACAMARYAVMAKPDASVEPEASLRELLLEPEPEMESELRRDRLRRHIENVEKPRRRRLFAHD